MLQNVMQGESAGRMPGRVIYRERGRSIKKDTRRRKIGNFELPMKLEGLTLSLCGSYK